MRARVPLDVDLEDRLLYGLTPTRLVYVVIGLLAAFSAWSTHWTIDVLRAASALLILAITATAAWGRWRGRAADGWAADIFAFVLATYRVRWSSPRFAPRLPFR